MNRVHAGNGYFWHLGAVHEFQIDVCIKPKNSDNDTADHVRLQGDVLLVRELIAHSRITDCSVVSSVRNGKHFKKYTRFFRTGNRGISRRVGAGWARGPGAGPQVRSSDRPTQHFKRSAESVPPPLSHLRRGQRTLEKRLTRSEWQSAALSAERTCRGVPSNSYLGAQV